jgi:polyisoprenoid-binding protein YceI
MKSKLMTAVLFAFAVTASAEEYTLDGSHSSAQFSVKHLMVSNVKGEFSKVTGKVSYDEKKPEATVVEATIDATTINTREPKRDAHLKSADFFDTEKFPSITFKSTNSWKQGAALMVKGDLTMHGVTKPVVLTLEGPTPEVKDPWGNFRRGATATTKINRADFGLTWNRALETGGVVVGEEVTITIDVEAMRPGAKK